VYADACYPAVEAALRTSQGRATILAYGQTGSGKTYSMVGSGSFKSRGCVQRAITHVFAHADSVAGAGSAVSVRLRYVQVYNEQVFDLLTDPPEVLDAAAEGGREGCDVRTEGEALSMLFLGNESRTQSDTLSNSNSSRSHSLFTLTVTTVDAQGNSSASRIHLVDLAGSERDHDREAPVDAAASRRAAAQRKEGRAINLSLLHLEQVIIALQSRSSVPGRTPHVPYRNSALTTLLRDGLDGTGPVVLLATLSPEAACVDESLSTARFAARCAQVKLVRRELTALSRSGREVITFAPDGAPPLDDAEEVQAGLEAVVGAVDRVGALSLPTITVVGSQVVVPARISPGAAPPAPTEQGGSGSGGSAAASIADSSSSGAGSGGEAKYRSAAVASLEADLERVRRELLASQRAVQEERKRAEAAEAKLASVLAAAAPKANTWRCCG
jgi:hypothetical protein